jgi:hypothetical protein
MTSIAGVILLLVSACHSTDAAEAEKVRFTAPSGGSDQVDRVLSARFKALGLPDPKVATKGAGGTIALRGTSTQRAQGRQLIAQRGVLVFRASDPHDASSGSPTAPANAVDRHGIDGAAIVPYPESQGEYAIRIRFNDDGKSDFDRLLASCRDHAADCSSGTFQVILDGTVLTTVLSQIGSAKNPWYDVAPFPRTRAREIAALVAGGPLPQLEVEPDP